MPKSTYRPGQRLLKLRYTKPQFSFLNGQKAEHQNQRFRLSDLSQTRSVGFCGVAVCLSLKAVCLRLAAECLRLGLAWFRLGSVCLTLGAVCRAADESGESHSLSIDTIIAASLTEQVASMLGDLSPDAREGYRHLLESSYLPADFDEGVLASLDGQDFPWMLADRPKPEQRRQATWLRFGLSARPDDLSKPLQYVVHNDQYVMNCFACHGGNLFGVSYPGAPNTLYGLQSLTEQVRRIKLSQRKPLGHMDLGSIFIPLGSSVGTSNAVMFGVALMNYRDADLNVYPMRPPALLTDHDMDAPAWWHFGRKHHIYIDGFAQKGHRGLMQFMMVRQNGPERFHGWEGDFRKVYAFLRELRPPKYPLPVDHDRARRGQASFLDRCSHCHGSYRTPLDPEATVEYPERHVPLEEVNTDGVRLQALTSKHRRSYAASWFAHHGAQETRIHVDGYVAPPLDGLWASAPYLHNGSVPTLWHLMHPEQRPLIWRRSRLGFDRQRVGLGVETGEAIPEEISAEQRRWYYDTRARGKLAVGHEFFNDLSESDKTDLLEFLKLL